MALIDKDTQTRTSRNTHIHKHAQEGGQRVAREEAFAQTLYHDITTQISPLTYELLQSSF